MCGDFADNANHREACRCLNEVDFGDLFGGAHYRFANDSETIQRCFKDTST